LEIHISSSSISVVLNAVGSFRRGNEAMIFISLYPWFDKNPLKKRGKEKRPLALTFLPHSSSRATGVTIVKPSPR
jgi:hypothetical protein